MAGTVKLCVPPELPPCVGELVGCADFVGAAEGLAVAECLGVAEVFGIAEELGAVDCAAPDDEDDPDGADIAVVEPLGPAAAPEVDPLAAHAVKPAPAAATAMIRAGIRRILMLLPSVK
jgi:hypothetical protein